MKKFSKSTVNLTGIFIIKTEIKVVVSSPLGIHARPAALIAKYALEAEGGIFLEKDGEKVDASSIIDILTLGCVEGSELKLHSEEAADEQRLKMIAEIIELGLED